MTVGGIVPAQKLRPLEEKHEAAKPQLGKYAAGGKSFPNFSFLLPFKFIHWLNLMGIQKAKASD